MRALVWLAVCTLVACSKPSQPSGAPDAASVTAAAPLAPAPVPVPVHDSGTAAPPEDAGSTVSDAGTAARDAGTAARDAGTTAATDDAALAPICRGIMSRYESIQKSAPLTCKTDADCSCHLVLTLDKVLAVSDRASAAKLQSMSMAWRKARCPTTPPAATPLCEPKCQAGRCR